jgi:hypothetical protein
MFRKDFSNNPMGTDHSCCFGEGKNETSPFFESKNLRASSVAFAPFCGRDTWTMHALEIKICPSCEARIALEAIRYTHCGKDEMQSNIFVMCMFNFS